MAWAQTLLVASFKGMDFDVVKTDDSSERATVEHSYPYVNGSDIEDMWLGARNTNVEAVFYGDDYEYRLQAFLAMLDQPGPGELIHPVFGSIKNALAKRSSVHHDAEKPNEASFTIEFIEDTPSNPFFDRTLPSQTADAVPQHGATATAAATEAHSSLIDRLRAANPLSGLDALRTALTGPLLAVMAQAGTVLSGLDVLAYPRAWGNDISALVGGLLDIRDFGAKLGVDWASIQSDLNAFSIFSTPTSSAAIPAPGKVTFGIAPTEAQVIAATAATIQVNTAVGLANAASFVMVSEAATPTLSPIAIEAIANTARSAIEVAIEQVRAIYGIDQSRPITEPLKDQALAIQDAARMIIEARPPLIWRTVDTPGNFRLLAHLWYGDHTRAPELYRLNGARSPFVNAGDRIHAYAK
jgi:prophage DNA circulation protein